MKSNHKYDITVVGGGHAGLEAAYSASQFGPRVALISMPNVPLGSTPCNPSIGGVGKGQVVREIDALGGLMSKIADLSALQCRTLNESKGYAVQSTRFQVDKDLYTKNAEQLISKVDNIEIIRGRVDKILESKESECGFLIEFGGKVLQTKKLIITAGTFLNGKLHCGEKQENGGRVDSDSSKGLSELFAKVSKLPLRFKTGTPARLNKNSIDFSVMNEQESDAKSRNFHWKHKPTQRFIEQHSCYITHTSEDTLKIIRDNKERSPIFNGQIEGIGPRYCPSIEDKAYRYLDRNVHHVFVEPEGIEASTVYPNGISTSLPKEIQEEFIRTIPGLEKAEIEVYGYAVEYDVVDTSTLDLTLQSKEVDGLYFAGQINGTSGYEEAAGQGLIAGINSALSLKGKEPFILSRNHSYIGVMIEDLVFQSRDEPYRLFTARSEDRLFIREDNVYPRMAQYRLQLELTKPIDSFYAHYLDEYKSLTEIVQSSVTRKFYELFHVEHSIDFSGGGVKISEILKQNKNRAVQELSSLVAALGLSFDERVIRNVAIDTIYSGYIKRSESQNSRMLRFDNKKINVPNLLESENVSFECKKRIEKFKPLTFGQLRKIDGIRPATLTYVASRF